MVKPSKKPLTNTAPLDPESEERQRLKQIAVTNNAIFHSQATGFTPLSPSKTVVKHHGKDILKKSHRKNRFLFSFPGLIGPVSGGKIGELGKLGSKNPVLYLDFPQGRMKLLGTIVYPKNKYLTLQFSKGGKNVMCDDWFDAMIIFSEAFWIGKKDENPDEERLDFPENLYKGQHAECDFQGGAGSTAVKSHNVNKVIKIPVEEESPTSDLDPESPERVDKLKSKLDVTPARHSERTAGKTFKFAESSSGDDDADSGSEISGGEKEAEETSRSRLENQGVDGATNSSFSGKKRSRLTTTVEVPHSTASETKVSHKGRVPLVQATISTLFKKAVHKMAAADPNDPSMQEASGEKQQMSQRKTKQLKAGEPSTKKKLASEKIAVVGSRRSRKMKQDEDDEDDNIEEFSSSSQDTDDSDEDWAD